MRNTIYAQVNEELARLNRIYLNAHFSVNRISINESTVTPTPLPPGVMGVTRAVAFSGVSPTNNANPGLQVSNKIVMNVNVELASVNQVNPLNAMPSRP
jgi:hypothetical protein